jgi:hypothetical protein
VTSPSLADRAKAVQLFNGRHGETERVLWFLSCQARAPLLAGEGGPILETLVWSLKSWWGVQGVSAASKKPIAEAISGLEWSEAVFNSPGQPSDDLGAAERVEIAVAEACRLGAPRKEFSLVSKVLHWLLPWQVPVYDNYVRRELGVPEWEQPRAYRAVARSLIRMARELETEGNEWIGTVDPRSPLRALDKYFWWAGGGETGYAAAVTDPWRVVRELGLDVGSV